MNEAYITRHRDLITDDALSKTITIVGAGAIGSFTALSLAKMGYKNITVYDFDVVDDVNIGNQFFPTDAIGKKKVHALAEMVYAFSGVRIEAVDAKVDGDLFRTDYLICAVDSMKVRRDLFEQSWGTRWLIDPRMGAEYASMQVLNINDDQSILDSYDKSLYTDSEAQPERCTAKATVYTSMLIAGQICKAVKDTSMGNDYLRSLDWSIANNSALGFDNNGNKK